MNKNISKKVGAGIVLYNPELSLLKKDIQAIINQVDQICLFDNKSDNIEEIERTFKSYRKITIIKSSKNLGIAFGLNKLLNWASENKYNWLLTMDQDSICSTNLIEEYSKYWDDPQIGLICPFVITNGKYSLEEYNNLKIQRTSWVKDPVDCITSACLTNVKIAKQLGGYTNKLFIDYVDTDINCKVINNGYKILRVNSVYLVQQMGQGKPLKLFSYLHKYTKLNVFRRLKVAAIYTDQRLYYSSRNSRYVRKTYKDHGAKTSVIFMLMFYSYFTLFYPADRSRIKMWKSIIKGFKDYKSL